MGGREREREKERKRERVREREREEEKTTSSENKIQRRVPRFKASEEFIFVVVHITF